MTLLYAVVTASAEVADTSSRSRKIAILSELLKDLEPSEVPIVVAFLSGVPRQGRNRPDKKAADADSIDELRGLLRRALRGSDR